MNNVRDCTYEHAMKMARSFSKMRGSIEEIAHWLITAAKLSGQTAYVSYKGVSIGASATCTVPNISSRFLNALRSNQNEILPIERMPAPELNRLSPRGGDWLSNAAA